jgi:hypothetical protein
LLQRGRGAEVESEDLHALLRRDMHRSHLDDVDSVLALLLQPTAGTVAAGDAVPASGDAGVVGAEGFQEQQQQQQQQRHAVSADLLYRQARILSWQSKWTAAEELWTEALCIYPDHPKLASIQRHRVAYARRRSSSSRTSAASRGGGSGEGDGGGADTTIVVVDAEMGGAETEQAERLQLERVTRRECPRNRSIFSHTVVCSSVLSVRAYVRTYVGECVYLRVCRQC